MKNTKYRNLYSFWLRQLQVEFVEICDMYGVDLQMPLFEIGESDRQLGSWSASGRTIVISCSLVANYSWSVTLQVLKHEMAHQLCSEMYNETGRPHGTLFKRACSLLGVPPEFQCSTTDLAQVVERSTEANRISKKGGTVVRKIEKLLELGRSTNEHEAALAMQKAQELSEKHNIARDKGFCTLDFTFIVIDKKRKRVASYQRYICMILNDYFRVSVVLSTRYDPFDDETYKTIEIIGTDENVTIADYCYHYLENQLHLLWKNKEDNNSRVHLRTQKNSFYIGLLHGFYQQLKKQRSGNPQSQDSLSTKDLVLAEDSQLVAYVASRFPRLTRRSSRKTTVCSRTYREGVKTGGEIKISEAITKTDQVFGGYLE